MIREEIGKVIEGALAGLKNELGNFSIEQISLEHPENAGHGDYSTNIAFALAKQLGKTPQEIAEAIKSKIQSLKSKIIERVEVAGGFVNFFLRREVLLEELARIAKEKDKFGAGKERKRVIIEFTDPNPFKVFHLGHLYSNTVGESLARILEATGAKVWRVNYQGDVGLHVAKAIYGMQKLKERMPGENASLSKKVGFLGECYAYGNAMYEPVDKNLLLGSPADEIDSWQKQEENEDTKRIVEINIAIYNKSDKEINSLYSKGRKWSLDYFDTIYKRLGTKFDHYYFESEVRGVGTDIVKKGLQKGVFQESQGAVIFPGEKYGLHSRVFINSQGLPTYEAKELGLAPTKYKDFKYDLSLIVTGNEITDYFRVVLAAMKELYPDLAVKTRHVTHGMVRLPEGKMSSRNKNIVVGEEFIDEVRSRVLKIMGARGSEVAEEDQYEAAEIIAVGAVKYSRLRVDREKDIIFDLEKSLSFEGDSGPYLQYTYARCKSILRKAPASVRQLADYGEAKQSNLSKEELDTLRTMYKFPEVVQEAAEKYAPSLVCNFVFELAQLYNNFYNTHSVLQADTEEQKQFRLLLTSAVAQLIHNSLYLFGIQTLEKM